MDGDQTDWSRVPPVGRAFQDAFKRAADRFKFDPLLLVAIATRESQFNPKARGSYGSRLNPPRPELNEIGLMQALPEPNVLTWFSKFMGRTITADDLWDPATNIMFGAWLLNDKRRVANGSWVEAVRLYFSNLPNSREDEDYQRDVLALYQHYAGGGMDTFWTVLQQEFGDGGYDDLRAELPRRGDTYGPIIPSQIVGVAIHNTGYQTTPATTWQQVAAFHIHTNGWNGVGYHAGTRNGRLAYLRDVTERGVHVKGRNHELVGFVFMGDYERGMNPSPADVDIARRFVLCVDRWLARQVPVGAHGVLQGDGKACPGPFLREWCKNARQVVVDPNIGTTIATALRGAPALTLNRGAALQRRIQTDGFWAISGEMPVEVGGAKYVGQLAQHPGSGERRVYYVKQGEWDRVLWATA